MTAEPRTAALVILRPGAGNDVRRFFSEAEFNVGPLVGESFSIEAPRELMESWFGDFAEREGTDAELDLGRLPPEVAGAVRAVATQAPPDFGPTSY